MGGWGDEKEKRHLFFGIAPLGLSQSRGMLGVKKKEKKKKAPTGAKLGTRLAWEFACLCVVGSPLGPLWPEAGGHSPGGSLASGSWTKEHGDRSMLTMLTWRNFLRGDGEQAIESRYFGFKTNLVPYLPLTPGMFWP